MFASNRFIKAIIHKILQNGQMLLDTGENPVGCHCARKCPNTRNGIRPSFSRCNAHFLYYTIINDFEMFLFTKMASLKMVAGSEQILRKSADLQISMDHDGAVPGEDNLKRIFY